MTKKRNKTLSLRAFLLAVGLTMAAIFAGAVMLPHDPYIRYQALSGTIYYYAQSAYERIHFDPEPLDVVFLGASRTGAAVDAHALEAGLRARGIDKGIANFALPASGFDQYYALAEEALGARKVGLLVISLTEQFPRDGHQVFGDIATARDVLRSPWLVNRNLPRNLAYLPVRQLKLALMTLVPDAFGYKRGFDVKPESFSEGDALVAQPAGAGRPEAAKDFEALEKEADYRRHSITRPLLPQSLSWVEFGVSQTYIRKVAALAAKHGARVAFLFLPFYDGFPEPAELDWVSQFGPVFSASFLRTSPANYYDVAHASAQGSQLVTEWLVEQLAPLLREEAPEPEP